MDVIFIQIYNFTTIGIHNSKRLQVTGWSDHHLNLKKSLKFYSTVADPIYRNQIGMCWIDLLFIGQAYRMMLTTKMIS